MRDGWIPAAGVALPRQPQPDLARLAGLVLAACDSGPGHDNKPYEVFHPGAYFLARLLAAVQCLSHVRPALLPAALGPSVEVRVHIPKKLNADTAATHRPLDIPTAFRRLYGSSIMDVVGPAVEPLLTPQQAAKRGGSCGANVAKVAAHLGPSASAVAATVRRWRAFRTPVHA